jgi:hypothetical protein
MPGIRQLALLIIIASTLAAQGVAQEVKMSAAQVVSFVRTSAKSSPDKDVAEYLRKVTMTDRLSDDALESCIQAGAGPRARSALMELASQSATLPETKKAVVAASATAAPPKPVGPAPPSEEEKQKALEKVTEYARGYIKNLPDFTCTQVTRRFVDPSNAESYRLNDTVLENLSYLEGHESYKVVSVNNKPMPDADHWKLGGTTSAGEFGTDMRALFDPSTQTDFEWDSWTTWRGRRTHKFSYRVSQPNSGWEIRYGQQGEQGQKIVAGYKGYVYVDRDTNMIMRIDREAEGIPAGFPVQNVKQRTIYDFHKIWEENPREYLVPASSLITSKSGRVMVKNETEFRLYRKFGTESVIKFGATDEAEPESGKAPAKKQN